MLNNLTGKQRLQAAVVAVVLLAAAGLIYQHYLQRPDLDGLLQSNGRIEATEIAIAAKTAGRIKNILVNEGDFVSAGQLLAEIESDALTAQLTQAEAQLRQAQSAATTAQSQLQQRISEQAAQTAVLAQRQAELAAAKNRAKRTGTLAQTGSVSKQLADDNDTLVASANAAVSAAKAQINAADAAIASAQAQILSAQSAVDAVAATVARVKVELADNQLTAALALATSVSLSSASCLDTEPVCARVPVRFARFFAAASSAWRCASTAV